MRISPNPKRRNAETPGNDPVYRLSRHTGYAWETGALNGRSPWFRVKLAAALNEPPSALHEMDCR